MIREVEGGSIENGVVKTNRRRFQSRGDANRSKAVEWSRKQEQMEKIDRSYPHRPDHRKFLVTVGGSFSRQGWKPGAGGSGRRWVLQKWTTSVHRTPQKFDWMDGREK